MRKPIVEHYPRYIRANEGDEDRLALYPELVAALKTFQRVCLVCLSGPREMSEVSAVIDAILAKAEALTEEKDEQG